MSDRFRSMLYDKFNLRETDELLAIWEENNRVEWSDLTFDVIREILQARLDEVPPQGEPILEPVEPDEPDEDAEAEEIHPNSPVFYDPQQTLRLAAWIRRLAVVAVVLTVLLTVQVLPREHQFISAFFNDGGPSGLVWLLTIAVSVFNATLLSVVYYFGLKWLASILLVLMEMEFNSRWE